MIMMHNDVFQSFIGLCIIAFGTRQKHAEYARKYHNNNKASDWMMESMEDVPPVIRRQPYSGLAQWLGDQSQGTGWIPMQLLVVVLLWLSPVTYNHHYYIYYCCGIEC